jgi:hypothetical protein
MRSVPTTMESDSVGVGEERTATDRTGALTRAHGSLVTVPASLCRSFVEELEGEEGGRQDGFPLETDDPCAREARLSYLWLVFS